jgi:uncharacterized protein YyaL (SSP411 family)
MVNQLNNSNSPYLLQHAHNPIEWYMWGNEALNRAEKEEKPIFLSIGYSACHWCHVMAHESFEDPEIASIMNENFINIKVDREERPDIDDIYMNAVISLTGQGGWPLSVFLTPAREPFFGGTYFPPVQRYNIPSFKEVLLKIAAVWQEDREGLSLSAANITKHLNKSNSVSYVDQGLQSDKLEKAAQILSESYDWKFGGWGQAPKFPQPMVIEFLLLLAARGNKSALDIATHALNSMAKGGLYDVVGGGFSRYSTDNEWLVPHFEKMLYDNAQLARVYLHAYLMTGDRFLRRICIETLDFIARELTHPEGGFFSSIDADSEGIEGKFYVWTLDEISDAIQKDDDITFLVDAYGINSFGNFDGANILQRVIDDIHLSYTHNLTLDQVEARLTLLHNRLFNYRSKRVRPKVDDKVLVSWNSMAVVAFSEAFRYLGVDCYRDMATRNLDFMFSELYDGDQLLRSWRNGKAQFNGYLQDYGSFANALITHYQSDHNNKWFEAARIILDKILSHFQDPQFGFFDTRDDHEELIARPKRLQDNAVPSGNSISALSLLHMAAYTGEGKYRDQAERALAVFSGDISKYPLAYGKWLCALDFALNPTEEVAILSDSYTQSDTLIKVLWDSFQPNRIAAISNYPPPPNAPALLHNRTLINGKTTAFVCQNHICHQPVNTPEALTKQLSIK